MKRDDIHAGDAVLATYLAWSPPEVERERHARELGVSWCSACWSDHAPDAPCPPRVEP